MSSPSRSAWGRSRGTVVLRADRPWRGSWSSPRLLSHAVGGAGRGRAACSDPCPQFIRAVADCSPDLPGGDRVAICVGPERPGTNGKHGGGIFRVDEQLFSAAIQGLRSGISRKVRVFRHRRPLPVGRRWHSAHAGSGRRLHGRRAGAGQRGPMEQCVFWCVARTAHDAAGRPDPPPARLAFGAS